VLVGVVADKVTVANHAFDKCGFLQIVTAQKEDCFDFVLCQDVQDLVCEAGFIAKVESKEDALFFGVLFVETVVLFQKLYRAWWRGG